MQDTRADSVLLVDDSEEQRSRVRKLLAARPGISVAEAESGRAALERAGAGDFDCILLDVRMPGLDGFGVAEELRKGGQGAFVPIIFITGAPAPDAYLKRGYSLGAVDFVSYPLIPEVFLAKLEVFLELSRKARALDRHAAMLEAEVRRRTAELEYQARLTRTIAENASSGLLLLDGQGRATYMNPAAGRIAGIAPAEAAGRPLKEILPGADPVSLASLALTEALSSLGSPRPVEGRFLRRDGSEYDGLCTITGLILEDGSHGAVAELQDVTERKRVDRDLRENEEKLHQARRMEAVGRLAGGIAHDFNNILTAINGYSSLCQGMAEPGGVLHASLGEIRAAGERAASLTRQLLAFSRQQVKARRLVDVNACVSESLVSLAALAGERIQLNLELDPELGPVRSDPEWIRQMLASLIRNSRDAMPAGGLVRIRTARRIKSAAGAGDGKPEIFSVISVADNGIGMDPNVKARIFEPFFTTKEFGRGAGMGLAIVDGIVRQCGGHIEVDSALGQGSTFRIYLPEADRPPAPGQDEGRGGGNRDALLIADGDGGARAEMRRALEHQGWRVEEAADADALAFWIEEAAVPLTLIVADLMLPGLSAADLAEKVRRRRPECRVLFTGSPDCPPAPGGELPESGLHFLPKPFAPSLLAGTVLEILESPDVRKPEPPRRA